jgi:hypothetical protein
MMAVPLLLALLIATMACSSSPPVRQYRTFGTPEDAVRALIEVVKAGDLQQLLTFFGPDGEELVDASDPASSRRNREVFIAAVAEGWYLADAGATRTLVIGNEEWPFPVPLAHDANGWRFDTAAGKEEVIARRIGRNELAVILICRAYVDAQRRYAQDGHDGKPAGLYAQTFRSDPGKQNGLYWPAPRGQKRSPLGDLVAQAEAEGRQLARDPQQEPIPFHGYYFKILTEQGPAAAGGVRSYLVNGELSAGFGLIAWPAQYGATGIMTFVVNQDGILFQKDLGPTSSGPGVSRYDPDNSWNRTD